MKRIYSNFYFALALQLGVSLLLLHISRYIFYAINYKLFPHIQFDEWINIILGGLKFDIAAVLYTNGLFVLFQIMPFPFKHRKKYRRFTSAVYLISNALMLILSTIDIIYFKFTLRRSTWMIFKEFSNETNILDIAVKSSLQYWYMFFVFIGLLIILYILFKKITEKIESIPYTPYTYVGNFLIFIFTPVLFIGGIRGDFKHTTRPITMSNAGEYTKNPVLIPLVLNTPFCIFRTIQQSFYTKDSFFTASEIDQYFSPIHRTSNDNFKNNNVVIIILESFGRESVGFYNKDLVNGTYKGYTPFLDSLLKEGFTSKYTFANGRKSIDALPSVLMSIPSGEVPYVLTPYITNKTESLPAILHKKGYSTAFFHGAPNNSMGFKALLNVIGVEKHYGMSEYGNNEDFDGTWGIWDEPFLQFTANKINELKEPFISTVFSVSSHTPFKLPNQYKNHFPKGDHPLRETIGYTDLALKRFFEKAKHMKWFKNTLFVITGDHASISYFDQYRTSWGNMTVPILFYHPSDTTIRKQENKVIQQIDIMPSVLSYLNYNEPYLAFGENVFLQKRKNIAINYYNGFQMIDGDYLLQMNGNIPASLFNYVEDPILKYNLIDKMPLKKDSMKTTLLAFRQQYHNRLIENRMTVK